MQQYTTAVTSLLLLLLTKFCYADKKFWLTAELVNVEWRKGCLTTGGCGDPRFKLTETNWASNEQVSISWSILEDFNQERSRTFVSHWKRGYPTDVTLVCEVVGIDPTYGFPRICDSTGNVQAFVKDPPYDVVTRTRQSENIEFEASRIVVELKGKCFNASLNVEKHEQQCPWCQQIQPQHQQLFGFVSQTDSETNNGTAVLHRFGRNIQYLYLALAVLAGIALLSTAAFACLLLAFIKQRKGTSQTATKCPVETYYPSAIIGDTVKITDDCRYEMPWDQKYRPLPHWPNNRNPMSCSISKPTPYTSGTLIYQTSRATTDDSVLYETPALVMSDHHNDSGHDSV